MRKPTKTFHGPDGIVKRELSDEEIQTFADRGDKDCIHYRFATRYQEAASPGKLQEKIDIIAEYLGLAEEE